MNIKELTNDYIDMLAHSNGITYNITNINSLRDRLDNPKTTKISIFSFNFGKYENTNNANAEFSLQFLYNKISDEFYYALTTVAPTGRSAMTGGTVVKDINAVKNVVSMPRIETALKRMSKKFSVGNKPIDIKDFCLRIIDACMNPIDYVKLPNNTVKPKRSRIDIVDIENVELLIKRLSYFDSNAKIDIQGKCLIVQ